MTININFPYIKDRQDSMFYRGETIIQAFTEKCTLEIFTVGHITLYVDDEKFVDDNACSELLKRNFTDKDISELYDEGQILESNWFEYTITFKDPKYETLYSEPYHQIDDCLEILNTFIKEGFTAL